MIVDYGAKYVRSGEGRRADKRVKAKKQAARLYHWKRYGIGMLFMLPWIIGFALFVAIPVGWSLFMSFHKVSVVPGGFKYEWLGMENYRMPSEGQCFPD